ncbi:MAG: DPP IV N-terminal domain-containing protein [Tannerellaceae bacterium]|nr:DPP IV N-terminal domain-containing protein [Tannerellaceae bacterium]
MKKYLLLFVCLLPGLMHAQIWEQLYQNADNFGKKYNDGYYYAIRDIEPLDSAGCFWYSANTPEGIKNFILDPVNKTVTPTEWKHERQRWSGDWSRIFKEDAKEKVLSPDSTKEAYISEGNLWVLDLQTQQKKQLSLDGSPYEYYSSNIYWSPDSKKNCLL